MLPRNKEERIRIWMSTGCAIGVLICFLEVIKSCTRI